MPKQHRFPLRRQIVWSMRLYASLTSIAVGAALFVLANAYVRTNTLQAAESSLRLMAASIETSLEAADDLINWAAVDSTVRLYLTRTEPTGTQIIAAYDAANEKYQSSSLQARIVRFLITDEKERFLQFGPGLTNSAAITRESVQQYLKLGYGMRFATDPLLPNNPYCLTISKPIRAGTGTAHRGTAYLALDTSVITSSAKGYTVPDGGMLYWEMGNHLWQIEGSALTETENVIASLSYETRTAQENVAWNQSAQQASLRMGGRKYIALKVALEGRSAALVLLMPETSFLHQRGIGIYVQLILFGMAVVWGLSFILQRWLHCSVTRPIDALQTRISAVGAGDFTPDPSVEWDNELGDIGRGINRLAADIDSLMARRLEDERRKQDLEYQMLQNEVNPHFIYNTLNSIRWMATIQHAPGIAEMVTAFARLTKSISKGTEKLVPLQEELALLNDYFTIQQYRYGGDLEIEVSRIEDERLCQECLIPRFTLQPLVENAIFHGLEPRGGHGSVLLDIRTDPETGDVLLTITDDGVGMPPDVAAHVLDEPNEEDVRREKFRHVGLWNVNRRIQYSFGESYGLTLESEEGVGTAVTIRLPYKGKGEK